MQVSSTPVLIALLKRNPERVAKPSFDLGVIIGFSE